jgi:hypothetical protein
MFERWNRHGRTDGGLQEALLVLCIAMRFTDGHPAVDNAFKGNWRYLNTIDVPFV